MRSGRLKTRLCVELLETRTMLSTCHVTRLTDQGIGKGFRGDLRYCINKVNSEPGQDVIDFHVTGTINLAGALPNLNSNIDIQGPGPELLTVRRDTGGNYRIFTVPLGATVQISGLTVSNGLVNDNGFGGNGGGISNGGNLTLESVVVSGNMIASDIGGGGSGGGIYNTGQFHLIGSRVENNRISSNPVAFSGGALGGGIANYNGSATIIDSTISGNHADVIGIGVDDGDAYGGGISNINGTVSLDRSTVAFNGASVRWWSAYGGGIYNNRNLLMTNSTLTGNHVMGILGAGGGGIFSKGSMTAAAVTIRHSTLTDNVTIENWGQVYHLAAIAWSGTMDIRNSILAGNLGTVLNGTLTASGHNLISNSSGGGGYAATDILDVDPMLATLADNGGPTFTHALLPGSPAIDAGDNTGAPMWDQRGPGFPRVVNGTVDIGAFEVQSSPLPGPDQNWSVLLTADLQQKPLR